MTTMAHAVAQLDHDHRAATVRASLAPFADRVAAVEGVVCFGAVAHPLGALALSAGDREEGARLLELAVDVDSRMGAVPWAERARRDLARAVAPEGDQKEVRR
jgi:hypothetical protein